MMSWYKELPSLEKHIIDVASVGTTVAVLTSYLPTTAAFLTVLWTAIRIFETDTIQGILGRKKEENDEDT